MWMVFVPPFVPTLDLLSSFRFSPCPSFRSSVRFARFALLPVFRFALSFRLFVWAYRGAVRLGRGGVCGRGGWLVVWRGEMTGRLGCAPFLSARVRRRWRWSLVFRSPRLASRLFCSSRRGGRCVACLASVGRGGCGCDVASSRFLVSCGRPVSSCVSVSSRLFSPLPFSSLPSFLFVFVSSGVSCGGVFGVGLLERVDVAVCGCWMWVVRCGVAVWCVVERAVGGSVMPCRVAERAMRDERRGEWRDGVGASNASFLLARLGGLSDGGGVVDGCGREVCRGRGGGVIRMPLLFFLASRIE